MRILVFDFDRRGETIVVGYVHSAYPKCRLSHRAGARARMPCMLESVPLSPCLFQAGGKADEGLTAGAGVLGNVLGKSGGCFENKTCEGQ